MLGGMEAQQSPGGGRPPPGWYPDPHQPGVQRWWDGAQWTQQTSGPQGFATPAAPMPPADADRDARQWALFAHLSALVTGFLGPLVIYLLKREDHPFAADQAREALNFNLSFLIYSLGLGVVAFVLSFVLIGFFLFFLFFPLTIGWLVLTIVAAVKASNGEVFRYPLSIRMVS